MDISFDLETLSLEPDAVVVSIGAVAFEPRTGEIQTPLYAVLDITDQNGGHICPDTVKWWMRQSDDARSAVATNGVPTYEALDMLGEYIAMYQPETFWQWGDRDYEWLRQLYRRVGLETPIDYRAVSDGRTLYKLFGYRGSAPQAARHNARDDAINQALTISSILTSLK